jgi:hypothetical protein
MMELDVVIRDQPIASASHSGHTRRMLVIDLFQDGHPLHPRMKDGSCWIVSKIVKSDKDKVEAIRAVYHLVELYSQQRDEPFELSEEAKEELIRVLKG